MKRWMVMSLFFAACGPITCIARGAKVKTPRGLRKIEELQVGDQVIVVDPDTLEQHVSVITNVRSAMRECGALHFGERSLRVTSSHPLYDPRAKQWAPAGDWLLGVREELVTELGAARVTQAERFVGMEEVFDLSVAHDLHTFVADGVVVHNKSAPRRPCPEPGEDGGTYIQYETCACGGLNSGGYGYVACEPDAGPRCECSVTGDSSWRTELGSSDTALRDGTWWTSIEREGAGEVLQVVPLESTEYPALRGSPNELLIRELGDSSAAFLSRSFNGVLPASGSIAFYKDGTFPRVLSLGAGQVVLLGVDGDRAWFQPAEGEPRWVTNVPSLQWVQFNWRLEVLGGGLFRVRPQLWSGQSGAGAFFSEATNQPLDDYYAEGRAFSFGDAGVPDALVLGHRSNTDGGSGTLRVTGVTLQ